MATRSRIAIENVDNTVTSIYCHFDGYLSHNGEILQNHFQDRDKVKQLIALGDLSCLGEDISEGAIDTIAYHRDRGEDFNQSQHTNVDDFFDDALSHVLYAYLFTLDGKWLVSSGGPVGELQQALKGEDVL